MYKLFFTILFLIIFHAPPCIAIAIRDAETEAVFSKLITPLLKAAGVKNTHFKIWIVGQDAINAYVTPDVSSVFITSGMIEFSPDPYVVSGVIAHELGHIFSNHSNLKMAEFYRMLDYIGVGYIIGILTSFTVSPDLGMAIASAGHGIGETTLMGYSRIQESIADDFALNILDKAEYKNFGLKKIIEHYGVISSHDKSYKYFASHPSDTQRLTDISSFVPKHKAKNFSPGLLKEYSKVRMKILAYFDPLSDRDFECEVKSTECRYALAIKKYQSSDTEKALQILDQLILEDSKDPYYHEVKGQILYKVGKMEASAKEYELAVNILGRNSFLMQYQLSRTLIYSDTVKAINLLNKLIVENPDFTELWYELSVAYDRADDKAKMHFALAYFYYYKKQYWHAKREADAAMSLLPADDKKNRNKIIDLLASYESKRR